MILKICINLLSLKFDYELQIYAKQLIMSNPESIQNNEHEKQEQKIKQQQQKHQGTYEQLMQEGKQVLDNLHFNQQNQSNFVFHRHTQPSPSLNQQTINPLVRTDHQRQISQQNLKQSAIEEESRKELNESLNQIVKKSSKIFGCNCLKSKCTKNYCQCFTQARKCNELCKCTGCQNQGQIQKRYRPNLEVDQGQRFCNCKKSYCLKKYCECYNSGVKCNSNCKCEQCRNGQEIMNVEVEQVKGEIKKQKSEKQIEQIYGKIDQIMKIVPKEQQQYVLSFLSYWLS